MSLTDLDMQTISAWAETKLGVAAPDIIMMTCSDSLMPLLLWCEGVGLLVSLDKTLHVMILYGKTYWLCTTGSSCCLGATGSCLAAASPGSGSKLVHGTICVTVASALLSLVKSIPDATVAR